MERYPVGLRPSVENCGRMNEKITKGQEHSSCAPAQAQPAVEIATGSGPLWKTVEG